MRRDRPGSDKARLELKELIRRLNRGGKTVFITSHVLPELEEICTSLAIMEKGKLLRVGKIEDVMSGAGRTKRVRIKLAAATPLLTARSRLCGCSRARHYPIPKTLLERT